MLEYSSLSSSFQFVFTVVGENPCVPQVRFDSVFTNRQIGIMEILQHNVSETHGPIGDHRVTCCTQIGQSLLSMVNVNFSFLQSPILRRFSSQFHGISVSMLPLALKALNGSLFVHFTSSAVFNAAAKQRQRKD